MPIYTPSQLQQARNQYRRLIHNAQTSVRIVTDTVTVQPDPRILSKPQPVFVKWDDFYCSIFDFLSGKTDRLLQERGMRDLLSQLGLTKETAIAVQYVPDLLLTDPDYSDWPDPPDTPLTQISNNLSQDDEILARGEWWKIKVVIPDSEGIQHTAFAAK